MNVLKKIYCRCFQTVFKLAIPILPYRNPFVMKSCTDVPGFLRQKGVKNVLVVTDEFLHSSGAVDKLKKALENNEIKYMVYDFILLNNLQQIFTYKHILNFYFIFKPKRALYKLSHFSYLIN